VDLAFAPFKIDVNYIFLRPKRQQHDCYGQRAKVDLAFAPFKVDVNLAPAKIFGQFRHCYELLILEHRELMSFK